MVMFVAMAEEPTAVALHSTDSTSPAQPMELTWDSFISVSANPHQAY